MKDHFLTKEQLANYTSDQMRECYVNPEGIISFCRMTVEEFVGVMSSGQLTAVGDPTPDGGFKNPMIRIGDFIDWLNGPKGKRFRKRIERAETQH